MQLNHSLNYLDKYLEVKVLTDKTVINYWNDDTLIFSHEHKIGMRKVDEEKVSNFILSDWVSGIIYTLQNISFYDRVPKHIYLKVEKYPSIFEKIIRNKSTYSQFYLGENIEHQNIHVIINKINYNNLNSESQSFNLVSDSKNKDNFNNNKIYERYTKTISQFKF